MRYRCCVAGVQQEDTVISIPPASMGLAGDDEQGEPFMIAFSHIRKELDTLKVVSFVPALEHEM
jgi:hypothetical protein